MTCFHCKKILKRREAKSYVPYHIGRRFLKRWWCEECYPFIDAEYPEDKD